MRPRMRTWKGAQERTWGCAHGRRARPLLRRERWTRARWHWFPSVGRMCPDPESIHDSIFFGRPSLGDDADPATRADIEGVGRSQLPIGVGDDHELLDVRLDDRRELEGHFDGLHAKVEVLQVRNDHRGFGGIEEHRTPVDRDREMLHERLFPGGDLLRGRPGHRRPDRDRQAELLGEDAAPDGNGQLDAIGGEIDLQVLQKLIGGMGRGRLGCADSGEQHQRNRDEFAVTNEDIHGPPIVRCDPAIVRSIGLRSAKRHRNRGQDSRQLRG